MTCLSQKLGDVPPTTQPPHSRAKTGTYSSDSQACIFPTTPTMVIVARPASWPALPSEHLISYSSNLKTEVPYLPYLQMGKLRFSATVVFHEA